MPRRFTIGRDRACDVPIADDSVSRRHAEVWLGDDGAVMISDTGSSNGSSVLRGTQRISLGQDKLLPGDQVRFGAVILEAQEIMAAIEARNPGALKAAPVNSKSSLVRCACGAIKTVGELCPGCHR